MKELEYLSEIWYAGCLDMCLVVSERISNLDKYFLVKKMLKVEEKCHEITGLTIYIWSFKTWKFLLDSFINGWKCLIFVITNGLISEILAEKTY